MDKRLEKIKSDIETGDIRGAWMWMYDVFKIPEHQIDILEMMKTAVQSNRNNENSLFKAFLNMESLFRASPDHRGEILEIMKIAVQSDKNSHSSLDSAMYYMSEMFEAAPEYRSEILETMKIIHLSIMA